MKTTTDTEIVVTKTISATDGVITFNYQIVPPQESVDHFQLVEQFPEPIECSAVRFDDHPDGFWEYKTTQKIAFTIDRPSPEPIETTFHVQSPTLNAEQCVSNVKTTVDSRAPESSTVDTDGGSPQPTSTNGQSVGRSSPDTSVTPTASHDLPAVGVLSTGSTDGVARTVLRATQNELAVFVAVTDEESPLAQITHQLGAKVVTVPTGTSVEESMASLLESARNESYPGLILAETCSDPIAFEATLEAFESSDQRIVKAVWEAEQTTHLVGIPAYNEADTVGNVVKLAREHADEVVVVDDGSTDGTATRARGAGATVIEHDRNCGYGQALQTIFEEASRRDVETLVILDADDQHDTRDIPRLLAKQQATGAEIVIGNRFGETATTDMPLHRRFGLWVINSLVNLSMGSVRSPRQVQDTQSGFRLYNATAICAIAEHTTMIDDRMSASTDILQFANSQGFTMAEVPTTITYDVSNPNTRHPISHGYSIVRRILTTFERERPVTVYGIPGLLLSLSGIGVGYWTLSEFATSGTVVSEYMLVSMLLVFLGTISVFMSVVQYSLNISLDQLGLSE